MHIDFFIDVINDHLNKEAVIYGDIVYTYKDLLDKINYWQEVVKKDIPSGSVVALQSDFNPDSIGLLLSLIENNNIIVPLSNNLKDSDEKLEIAEVEYIIKIHDSNYESNRTEYVASHKLIRKIKENEIPGIIIFSSGSTGEPKLPYMILHDS